MESFQSVSCLNKHLDIGHIEVSFYYCFLIDVNKMLSFTNMRGEGNLSSYSSLVSVWNGISLQHFQYQLVLGSGLDCAWYFSPVRKWTGWGFPGFWDWVGLCSSVCFLWSFIVFDLWLLNVLNRAKRPNCFLSSGPTHSQTRKSYLYLTLMCVSFLSHLIADQMHKYELKKRCLQTTQM